MAVEIANPTEIVNNEIASWALQAIDHKSLAEEARLTVGTRGDEALLRLVKSKIDGRRDLSHEEVAEVATQLEAILVMRPHLDPVGTTVEQIGVEFSAALAKSRNFINNEQAIGSFRRLAGAIDQLATENIARHTV